MGRAPTVCGQPGCPNRRPCSTPGHEPNRRSPSSRRTSASAWQTRIRPYVLKRDGYRCQHCGADLLALPPHQRQVDHLDPVSQGGSDNPARLVAACADCNNRRGNR